MPLSGHSYFNMLAIITAGLIISIAYLSKLAAPGQVSRFLGDTGLTVLNRIMGMLLRRCGRDFCGRFKSAFPQLL
ncbi:MAG: hypothetical protein U1E92_06700 [Moraxella osloensis]